MRWARLRSTLVVAVLAAEGPSLNTPGKRSSGISRGIAKLVFRPDLTFALEASNRKRPSHPLKEVDVFEPSHTRGVIHYLNSDLSVENNARQAAEVVLAWMSSRLRRRLGHTHTSFASQAAVMLGERVDNALPCPELD